MTPIDRTPTGTESSSARYAWLPVVTTLATLAAVLILAFTGNGAAAIATAAVGAAAGGIQITVHIRR
ncbi:hypothetical protein [Streptomyces pseudovenezuelae]|uniref:hypothetical protein n=1 Tax=Streptomyces pseudovenezuelae TaxID=67350 RepID=UPI002E81D670|nr:hypothetical protein [Streptomyces pseudovenezuelae]WUA85790.1 hypothetical protein OHO81_00020 [Streptomyces pseudovenezuelae]WUA93976.1 hypothetical protein OHO81_44595 [Streptomyces pseudovenezuelae]